MRNNRGTIRRRGTAWQADFGVVNGKRKMKSFPTKAEAENWLHEQSILIGNQGIAAFSLTDAERLDAFRALEILRTVPDATLEVAAEWYRKHVEPTGNKKTVQQVIEDYIEDSRKSNLRPSSIVNIEHRLKKFSAVFGQRPIAEIGRKEATNWVKSIPLSRSSQKHCQRIAHGLFNFAVEQEYVTDNPFWSPTPGRRRRKIIEDESLPECLKWQDARKLLVAALENDTSMVAPLAVQLFGGLRVSEVRQLTWDSIDLVARRITVSGGIAKRRRTRFVPIEDALLAWVGVCPVHTGYVAPQGQAWRSRFDAIRNEAGLTKWPHNAARHSFASHFLAYSNDPQKTAFILGHHGDTNLLYQHYRALITSEDGVSYFAIRPPEAKVIQMPVTQPA